MTKSPYNETFHKRIKKGYEEILPLTKSPYNETFSLMLLLHQKKANIALPARERDPSSLKKNLSSELKPLGSRIQSIFTSLNNLSLDLLVVFKKNLSSELKPLGRGIQSISTKSKNNLSLEPKSLGSGIQSISPKSKQNLSSELKSFASGIQSISPKSKKISFKNTVF